MGSWPQHQIEDLKWHAPILRFQIGHSAMALDGSTKEEVQHWEVDLDLRTASIVGSGRGQVHRPAPKFDVQRLASELAEIVQAEADDDRLVWINRDVVLILVEKIEPLPSGSIHTISTCREHFSHAIESAMSAVGWQRVLQMTYVHPRSTHVGISYKDLVEAARREAASATHE